MALLHANRPPARNGVGASCVLSAPGPWSTWLEFLQARFPAVSRAQWEERLAAGEVLDARGQPIEAGARFQPRAWLYYFRTLAQEPRIPFEERIVWQDAHLLVADKPHFLPVIPSGKYVSETLLVRLKGRLQLEHLVPIHRIDRDTAGLVMFSVNPRSRDAYHALFRERKVHKIYHGVAPWQANMPWPLVRESRIVQAEHFMQQQEVPGVPNAITRIRPLEVRGALARYELVPLTGQRHQLRVHMQALGMPLLNDGIYPKLTPEGPPAYDRPLQLLAKAIGFVDPLSGKEHRFESCSELHLPAPDQSASAATETTD